ncbi:hypothetical protein PZA11_000648 [Diplocarpon coronariae]|nr:hypothetical protein JHW43_005301 [Diplocarpon mali]
MARKSGPQPLTLGVSNLSDNADPDFLDGPKSSLSPRSSRPPRSPFRFNHSKRSHSELPFLQAPTEAQQTTTQTLSSSHTSPSLSASQACSGGSAEQQQQKKERPPRSGFFSKHKKAKSSIHPQKHSNLEPACQSEDRMSRDTDRSPQVSSRDKSRADSSLDRSIARKAVGGAARSEASPESKSDSHPPSTDNNAAAKKSKPKPFGILSRSKSLHEEQSPRAPSPTNKSIETEKAPVQTSSSKPAPPAENPDRSLRSMMSSTVRQRSEDRQPSATRDPAQPKEGSKLRDPKEQTRSQTMKESRDNGRPPPSFSSSLREGGGNTFLNNLKSSATKGAGALSKGLFGKGGRNGSHEKEPTVDDEHYQLKVLTLPLMEQTRLTRISKKLEDSKDKTEFWMPAFPWRAIDYLNYKGSDVEGLYRVPGSGPQIKKWQRRFDEDFDIDLFEQDDLYDINIVGSMLKAWLRELPDELFPKTSQDRVARECPGQEEVPQLLIDELSNLSPFNYYLLFAITCHLSLLLAHSNKNKMDFRNLCICFQPCMKIDAYCFKFLVCNWRECWQGCKTEQFYIEQEYMLFDMITPSSAEGRSSTAIESHDERNVSSSDSSKPSTMSIDQVGQKSGSGQSKKLPSSQNQSASGSITTLTIVQERTPTTPPKRNTDMRPLSPIKPLSPIGF